MNLTWGILSKYRNEIYGLSIIWIILFHGIVLKYCNLEKGIRFLVPIFKHGNFGVEIFLLMSGVCLYYSLENDNDLKNFYIRRLIKIFVAYILITWPFWAYEVFIDKIDIFTFVKNITFFSFWSEGYSLVWFIAFIFILYLLYPYIYIYILKKRYSFLKICCLIVMTYFVCWLVFQNFPVVYKNINKAITRIPIFLLGCYLGPLVYENVSMGKCVRVSLLISCIFGVVYFYLHPFGLTKCLRAPYFIAAPGVLIFLCLLLDFLKNNEINRILSWFGNISLELYLIHVIGVVFYLNSDFYTKSAISNFYKYIILVGGGSVIYCKLITIYIKNATNYIMKSIS